MLSVNRTWLEDVEIHALKKLEKGNLNSSVKC